MPYKLVKNDNGSYAVVNIKTGYVHSKGTTLKKAKSQLRLLEMIG